MKILVSGATSNAAVTAIAIAANTNMPYVSHFQNLLT